MASGSSRTNGTSSSGSGVLSSSQHLEVGQFYGVRFWIPQQFNDPSPQQTPVKNQDDSNTFAYLNITDPPPGIRKGRLEKRTAVVVHLDHSTDIATIFVCSSKPSTPEHRSVPLDDTPHCPYQPKPSLISYPPGSFNGRSQGYVKFMYAIKARVVYVESSCTGNPQKIGIGIHQPPPDELSFHKFFKQPPEDPPIIIKTSLDRLNYQYLVSLNQEYHTGVRYTFDGRRIGAGASVSDNKPSGSGGGSTGNGGASGGGSGGNSMTGGRESRGSSIRGTGTSLNGNSSSSGIFFGPPPNQMPAKMSMPDREPNDKRPWHQVVDESACDWSGDDEDSMCDDEGEGLYNSPGLVNAEFFQLTSANMGEFNYSKHSNMVELFPAAVSAGI